MRLSRDLNGPGDSRAIRDVVAGVLAAEIVRPSTELWFLSAWVTDLVVLDNSTRAFTSVRPDWPAGPVRLSDALEGIAGRGGRVAVIVREVDHNRDFLSRMKRARARVPGRIGLATSPDAHDKGLVGDDYLFEGSMNFTLSGFGVNDEHVLLRVDAEAAAARRLALRERWSEVMRWG